MIKDSKNKIRARAATWSASDQDKQDNSNSTNCSSASVSANANANANARKILHKQQINKPTLSLLPLHHKRQTSNSSQISKLSFSSWDYNINNNSTNNNNNNNSNLQDELKLEMEDKTPTAGNSRNQQNRFRQQDIACADDSKASMLETSKYNNNPRMLGGGIGHGYSHGHGNAQETFPIPVPGGIDDMRTSANATSTNGAHKTVASASASATHWQQGQSLDNFKTKRGNRDSSIHETKDLEMKLRPKANTDVTMVMGGGQAQEQDECIYPPNINIATGPRGPLTLTTTWTDDSANTSIKSLHEHQNQYQNQHHDTNTDPQHSHSYSSPSHHRRPSQDEKCDDYCSISFQPSASQDTFDTPNSRGSKTPVVRFVHDVKTPSSYVRKPPHSLLLEDDNFNNNNITMPMRNQHHQEDLGLKLSSKRGSELSIPPMMENSSGDACARSHSSLRPSKGIYSYNYDPEDPNQSQNLPFLSPLNIASRHNNDGISNSNSNNTTTQWQQHETQASFGASIDSMEYNSMRHMDSDTLNKMSNIMGSGSRDDSYLDRGDQSQDEYHDGDNNGNNDNDRRNSPRGKNGQKQGICERIISACWCFPHAPKPSWSRVSSAVVRHAPCFWCCLRRSETGGTDRVTLTRLNVLCAIFALWQFGVGIFILVVFLSSTVVDRGLGEGTTFYRDYYNEALTPNLWMMSGSLLILSMVGFVLLVTMVLTIPVIRRVNLVGAIRFMWVLYWILPLQIFLVIALFDYHNVTDVWIKHWWRAPSMAWFRKMTCDPGTANEQCLAPMKIGENSTNVDEWCIENYNGTTNCEVIRESAINTMARYSYSFFYFNSIVGGVLIILLLLSLGLLEGIISAPIVQRSKETNISLWLTFPIIFCFAGGMVLLFSPSSLLTNDSGSDIYWIGVCYMLSGATFTVSALLSWFM